MKTANLSLGIGIYTQFGVKCFYKSHLKLYSIVIVCLYLCECTLKLCMVMNNIMHQVRKQQNQKFDLKNNLLLENFCQIPQEIKIFYHKQFSHYVKYSKVIFSQTMVYRLILYYHLNSKNLENLIINEAVEVFWLMFY